MQSTLVDVTSYLQLCSAKLPGYRFVIEADSRLTGESVALITGLLTLFFLVKHGKSSITYLL